MKKLLVLIALSSSVIFGCNNKEKQEATLKQQELDKQMVIKQVRDSLRLDSFKKEEVVKKQVAEEARQKEAIVATKKSAVKARSNYTGSATRSAAYGGEQPTAKKKGWSEAAKGAVIGGAAGAVGGAIIDKKKGRGAVIGGVVGAGGGYLIGRDKDKKSGRAN